MKKKNIINLIKYHAESNDSDFRNEAYEIAKHFDKSGDYQLSEYIIALLSSKNTFVPQLRETNLSYLKKLSKQNEPLPLPELIKNDILGIINAINKNAGVNKFLFEGVPGTGKTESAKQIARILDQEIYIVEFQNIIDSKLGQTPKNILSLFEEINTNIKSNKVIILFDEIDALAIDRVNSHDLREMGRATSALLKGMDSLSEDVVLIATTNLFSSFDKALVRRFDAVINFNRYTKEDLIEIAEALLNALFEKFKVSGRNIKLFKKMMGSMDNIPFPGELKNLLKTSIAFSNPANKYDYLIKLWEKIKGDKNFELKDMQRLGFTLREIEILTGISKSQASRELKEEK